MTPALRAAWLWLTDDARTDENVAATRARIAADPAWSEVRRLALAGDEAALDALVDGVAMHAHAAMLAGLDSVMALEGALDDPPARAGWQGPRRRRRRQR